ncbi:MAG: TIGR04255 family protein [Parcubacteria group bacterium]
MKKKCYKTNCLEKVIFRLDFEKVELGSLEEFNKKELSKEFILQEPKKGKEGSFRFDVDSGEVTKLMNEFLAYTFENKQKTKRFEVSEKYAFIEYDKYSSSEELFVDLKTLVEKFTNTFEVKTINRLGLRFINEIKLSKEKNPLDWKNYIDKNLIGLLDFSMKGKEKISRAMSQLVFKKEKGELMFNFGIFNKEYPNEIATKEFILDFDCYSTLPFEISEEGVLDRAKIYHNHIESLFEQSITDKFRKFLNK